MDTRVTVAHSEEEGVEQASAGAGGQCSLRYRLDRIQSALHQVLAPWLQPPLEVKAASLGLVQARLDAFDLLWPHVVVSAQDSLVAVAQASLQMQSCCAIKGEHHLALETLHRLKEKSIYAPLRASVSRSIRAAHVIFQDDPEKIAREFLHLLSILNNKLVNGAAAEKMLDDIRGKVETCMAKRLMRPGFALDGQGWRRPPLHGELLRRGALPGTKMELDPTSIDLF